MKNPTTSGRVLRLALALLIGLTASGLAQDPPPQAVAPEQAPASVLKDISYQKIDIAEQLQVVIKVDGPFQLEIFELIAPKRLVIDFSSVSKIEAQPIYEVNDIGLMSIRTGQFQPNVARVVFDLDARLPSHSITTLPDGVKVTFWQEAVVQPEVTPETKPQEQPPVKPVVPAVKRPSFFARISPGLTFFLKPSFAVEESFDLYGETAEIAETFDQQINPVFDISLGKYINPKFSIGLGASLQLLKVNPALDASLPHPFVYDEFREVSYTAEDLSSNMWVISDADPEPRQVSSLSSSLWTISVYGLYSFFQTDKIDLAAGPILGFSFGKLFSLSDFELSEEAPYESQNVAITSTTFLENKFFKIDPGFLLSGTMTLSDTLSVFLTLRMHYVDVMIEELERRASLFRINALLGIQLGF